jgi:hypothetical protein
MTSGGALIRQRARLRVSPDVVVIPGIMGSTLQAGDQLLRGGDSLGWYARAWRKPGSSLEELADAESAVVLTSGVDSPTDATVTVHRDDDLISVDHPSIYPADGRYQASVLGDCPGIYRVTVAGGGTTPVTQLVLAVDPHDQP